MNALHPAYPIPTHLRTEREALARADLNLARNRAIEDVLVKARRALELVEWPETLMSDWGDRDDILGALRGMTPDLSEPEIWRVETEMMEAEGV